MWKFIKDNIRFKAEVREGIYQISDSLRTVRKLSSEAFSAIGTIREDISTQLSEIRKDNNRLFRDITEELDDLRKDQADGFETLKDRLSPQTSEKSAPSADELIRLIRVYRASLFSLEQMLENDPAWKQQAELLQEKLRREEASAGIYVFGKEGDPVNLTMHQIAEVIVCDNPAKDKTIAEVYEEGLIIHGKTVQKAVVSAYRYGGTNHETEADYRN